MQPLLKGRAERTDRPPEKRVVKFALWPELGTSAGEAKLAVNLSSPIQCICDEWLKLMRAGLRVTIDGEDWQLRQFYQFPSPPPPHSTSGHWPLPIWAIHCELER